MNINILSSKYFKKYIAPSFIAFIFLPTVSANAANVTPVYLDKPKEYRDSDIPPAIKLNEAVDGLKSGTYLYRVTHGDIAYYTPNTPAEYRDTKYEPDVNKKNYREWGPWKMARNQVNFSVDSSKFYGKEVEIKKGATVYASTSTNASQTLGKTSKAIKVLPRAYTKYNSEYIYFSLKGTPYNGKTVDNIGRVLLSEVNVTYTPTSIFRSAVKVGNGYDYVPKNFSILGNYKDTTDSSHAHLETGRWVNPSYAPVSVRNKKGEWSHIGYNAKGEPIMNPYFPSTSLHYLGCAEPKNYDWKTNPFGRNNTFDGAAYADDRYELMESLFENGVFDYTGTSASQKKNDINNQIKKFSFSTHPTKDTAILLGQRSIGTHERELAVLNPPGDLYLASLKVYDNETEIASYTYNISTGKCTRKNASNVVPGKKYTVKVKIGNGKKRKILASKNQATIGFTKEEKFLDLKTVKENQLSNVLHGSSKNAIKAKIGSLSSDITFEITAPTDAQVFDIYGLVGNNHDFTDNLDYTNDAGFVRMYTTKAPFVDTTITTGKANLKATAIQLLDNSGEVVYSSDGSVTKKAIIPNTSYKIRYVMKNVGQKPSVTTITAGREDQDGTWHPSTETVSYPKVEVPISYSNTLKVNKSDGSLSEVSSQVSNHKLEVNGSTSISLEANKTYTYTTEALYFANPYLKSSFTINATGMANSDTTDDTASTTIEDLYDAVISDVKVYPAYEYVFSGDRYAIFNITYKAKIDAAQHIKDVGNITSKVKTRIVIGNRTLDFKDVLIAKDGYQEFSHTVENVLLKPDTTGVRASVTLNFDRHVYETNYNNNLGNSNTSIIKVVANPFNGLNSDKASHIDTSNGASLNGGGVLNNNCLIPRRSNSWTMSHRKHSWNEAVKSYNINGFSYSANVYTTSDESSVTKSYTESFKIKKVEFKSKETEGKGTDGWINLLSSNPDTLDLAKVKAGYGFELRIVSEYRTNATRTQPIPNSTTSYTGIIGDNDPDHASNKGINYSDELFVELPGTEGANGTRKILSTTGYAGTTNGLVISEKDLSTSSEVVKEFTYTIKPSNTLGISQVGKIFIPTGLKDGKYKISIYTPPISGAISDGKNKYTSLCDRRDVYINVSGSYTDDLNSNIIQ